MPTIEIDGLEELKKALRDAPEIAIPIAKEAMFKSIAAIEGRVKPYPPSTDANQPGRVDAHGKPMGYYERGRGWWYPIIQRATMEAAAYRDDEGKLHYGKSRGAIKAKRKQQQALGIAGYKLRATSEDLKGKWAKKVRQVGKGVEGIIGNSASYVDYVVGMSQARIHAERNWPRIDTALEDSIPDIEAAWTEALDELAKELTRDK